MAHANPTSSKVKAVVSEHHLTLTVVVRTLVLLGIHPTTPLHYLLLTYPTHLSPKVRTYLLTLSSYRNSGISCCAPGSEKCVTVLQHDGSAIASTSAVY